MCRFNSKPASFTKKTNPYLHVTYELMDFHFPSLHNGILPIFWWQPTRKKKRHHCLNTGGRTWVRELLLWGEELSFPCVSFWCIFAVVLIHVGPLYGHVHARGGPLLLHRLCTVALRRGHRRRVPRLKLFGRLHRTKQRLQKSINASPSWRIIIE